MNLPAVKSYPILTPRFLIGLVIHIAILAGLTWLFCWGTAVYTVRKATDALFAISFCYVLLGITIWIGRALRFYNQTEHFTSLIKVTSNDRSDLPPVKRGWLLLVYENRVLFAWVLAGLLLIVAAVLLGKTLPPDHVLTFLVRPDLPPQLKPGALGR